MRLELRTSCVLLKSALNLCVQAMASEVFASPESTTQPQIPIITPINGRGFITHGSGLRLQQTFTKASQTQQDNQVLRDSKPRLYNPHKAFGESYRPILPGPKLETLNTQDLRLKLEDLRRNLPD